MLRSVILAAARSNRVERLIQAVPMTADVVNRFVAGRLVEDALRVTRQLADRGFSISVAQLAEGAATPEQAEATRREYLQLISALAADQDLARVTETRVTEISVKLSALGQRFDERLAEQHARAICAAAAQAGTMITLDMEDHTTTDSTLEILSRLRATYPNTGAVVQAYLRRTEGDCRDLAGPGSRVRLCKGAYREPETVAYRSKLEVDKAYVRCLNILMSGDGYPMLATHDPRLISIAEDRAKWFDRAPGTFEFQLLYGVRPREQARLAGAGYTVRVYVPYGTQWYGYLMRRLAERPANLAFFARALATRR